MSRVVSVGLVAVCVCLLSLLMGCDDGDEASGPRWTMVHEGLDSALFSVWGSSAQDVWVVGADQGGGPLVLQWDGTRWQARDTGARASLWWVFGDGDGDLWMSGERGTIVHYRRGEDRFEVMETPGDAVLYGIFPLAPDDVWAVGGERASNTGVVWHYDGTSWSVALDVPQSALEAGAFFKVWGRSADDLWVVGLGGVALHRDASGWQVVELPQRRPLYTAHGNATSMFAVGGFGDAMIVHSAEASSSLVDATPSEARAPQLNGVWVPPDGTAIACGVGGSVWRYDGDGWRAMRGVPATELDFHGAYVDPEGGIWVVGGFVTLPPFDRGMLAYFGERQVPSAIVGR